MIHGVSGFNTFWIINPVQIRPVNFMDLGCLRKEAFSNGKNDNAQNDDRKDQKI